MATKMKKSSNKVNNVTNKQLEVLPTNVSRTVNTTTSTATSSPLQTFSNSEFGDVRVIMQDDEPWFVGKDVADSLDYQNGSRDINRHVAPEDRTKGMVFDGNQRKETILINESGLYSLILSSKLPSAKKFKRWVTSEVLPSIRKTGGYVDENRSDLFLDTYLPFADDTTSITNIK